MSDDHTLRRLLRWAKARIAPEPVDPADMGTAFGMEMSFDAAEDEHATVTRPQTRYPAAPRRSNVGRKTD